MKYTQIDAADAPAKPPSPARTDRTILLRRIVSELEVGKVARIELEGTETARGTKTAISRAATVLHREIRQWYEDGVLYVELEVHPPYRPRPDNTGFTLPFDSMSTPPVNVE